MDVSPSAAQNNMLGSLSARLSSTTSAANTQSGLTPLYDRQYITLHNLLEREMRQRVESEKMIRDDMTQLQEAMARICNQIQEVATDLKGNLPRLFQETKELRRDTQQLSLAWNSHSVEMNRLSEVMSKNKSESDTRFQNNEQKMQDNLAHDRVEKNEMWHKLCTKQVVQDLADKVGCMDMEAHAKFLERRQEYETSMDKINDLEKKVQQSLDEFLRGINKCDYLYTQCNNANVEFKKASEKVVEEHREMIDSIIFPRIERCEGLLNQEMCERVDCLKKIAHELVHSKEQNDKVKDQVERLAVDLSTSQAHYASQINARPQNGDAMRENHNGKMNTNWDNLTPLDRSLKSAAPASTNIGNANNMGNNGTLLSTPRPPSGGVFQKQPQIGLQQNTNVMIGGKVYPPGTKVIATQIAQ